MGPADVRGAAEVIAHEKECPARFRWLCFRQTAVARLEGEGVAAAVIGSAAATSGRSGTDLIGDVSNFKKY